MSDFPLENLKSVYARARKGYPTHGGRRPPVRHAACDVARSLRSVANSEKGARREPHAFSRHALVSEARRQL